MFLAHINDLKNKTYIPIEQLGNRQVLISSNGYRLVSNVCPHQGSLISTKSGDTDIRVCPYHNWSFELSGKPVASGRTTHYCINTTPLSSQPVYEFCNMLFTAEVLSKHLSWLDLSSMRLMEQRIDVVRADATHVMDIFLDVDHIESIHRGVYDKIGFSNISNVQWHYYDWGSLQLVNRGDVYGAAWLAIYPGTMIEWQDGALFVTVTESISDKETRVHVFKYMDITREDDWLLNESIWEEAWLQDKKQAENMACLSDVNLEESKQHFREWLRNDRSI